MKCEVSTPEIASDECSHVEVITSLPAYVHEDIEPLPATGSETLAITGLATVFILVGLVCWALADLAKEFDRGREEAE